MAIDRLVARREVHLREKTLWRMLYGTARRAEEMLGVNIEDLDFAGRRCPVKAKGARWACSPCSDKPSVCAGCGETRRVVSRDREGKPRCADCPDTAGRACRTGHRAGPRDERGSSSRRIEPGDGSPSWATAAGLGGNRPAGSADRRGL
jgi:integrase